MFEFFPLLQELLLHIPLALPLYTALHRLEFVCESNSAKTISEFSHNRAWELAKFGDEIKYNSVFLIFPQEVSAEAMEWADQEVKQVAAKRPQKDSLDRPVFGALRARVLETLRQ